MDCPHCKLVNPPTAKRCDCGYDFETKTLESSYAPQRVSKDIKKGLVVIAIYSGLVGMLALISGEPLRLLLAALWAGLLFRLYNELNLERKDSARRMLALLTFPFGTAFFLSSPLT